MMVCLLAHICVTQWVKCNLPLNCSSFPNHVHALIFFNQWAAFHTNAYIFFHKCCIWPCRTGFLGDCIKSQIMYGTVLSSLVALGNLSNYEFRYSIITNVIIISHHACVLQVPHFLRGAIIIYTLEKEIKLSNICIYSQQTCFFMKCYIFFYYNQTNNH